MQRHDISIEKVQMTLEKLMCMIRILKIKQSRGRINLLSTIYQIMEILQKNYLNILKQCKMW